MVLAVVFAILLVKIEKRQPDPIIPFQLMKNPVASYVTANTLQFICQAGVGYIFPFFFKFHQKSGKELGLFSFVVAIGAMIDAFLVPFIQKIFINKHIVQLCAVVSLALILGIIFTASNATIYLTLYCVFMVVNTIIPFVVLPSIILTVPKNLCG